MELAQLLVTPGTLLTAFIFFWKQSKAISHELKREIVSVRDEVFAVRVEMHDMNGRLGRVEGLLMTPEVGRLRHA